MIGLLFGGPAQRSGMRTGFSGHSTAVGGGAGSGGGSVGSVAASGEKAAVATRSFVIWRSVSRFPSGSDRQAISPFQPPMTSVRPSGEKRVAPTGADAGYLESFFR